MSAATPKATLQRLDRGEMGTGGNFAKPAEPATNGAAAIFRDGIGEAMIRHQWRYLTTLRRFVAMFVSEATL